MYSKPEFSLRRSYLAWLVIIVSACCLLLKSEFVSANSTSEHCTDVATTASLQLQSITRHNPEQRTDLVLSEFMRSLQQARVVVIGETHDNWAHHLTQLEIVCRLVAADSWRGSAIGFEQFQTPYQTHLDSFAVGESSIDQLLTDSDYFTNWGYDFRLYEPIVEFAAANAMKLLALNASAAVVELVRNRGLANLDDEDASTLAFDIEPASTSYRERLMDIYSQHAVAADGSSAEIDSDNFQRFIDVQRTWEGTMTATAAHWLEQNPSSRLVILVGAGHMLWPETIPDQLRRHGVEDVVSVAMDIDGYVADSAAVSQESSLEQPFSVDYSLKVSSDPLTSSGKMGIALESTADGVTITGFSPDSGAQAAGIHIGDRLTAINGEPVDSYNQVRQRLWKAAVGDVVEVDVRRQSDNGDSTVDTVSFPLR